MNKAKARKWKWIVGAVVTALLLWHLTRQIQHQLTAGTNYTFWPAGMEAWIIAACLLMPVNIALESQKWKMLVGTAFPITFSQALVSTLSGIAASIVTPNRIGEYPARVLLLKQKDSTRLVSVSVLGAFAQFLALMAGGLAGLTYYLCFHPEPFVWITLIVTALVTSGLVALYFSFERWAPAIEGIRWLRRLHLWGRLLHRFSARDQLQILGLSLLRFCIYATQFWLLLRWQGVALPAVDGLLLSALFFWAMAIIPSISLAELGIRGTVAIFLFQAYSPNVAGIATATFVLWCINLVLPAITGAVLFFAKRKA